MNPKLYRPVAAAIIRQGERYLLVKKPRKEHEWQFPQGGVDEGETHLQAAIRELNEECGATLQADFSESPLGSYHYDFPKGFSRHAPGMVGAEVIFFSANFLSGVVEVDNDEIIDHSWDTKSEIKAKVAPEYWDVVKNWL